MGFYLHAGHFSVQKIGVLLSFLSALSERDFSALNLLNQ